MDALCWLVVAQQFLVGVGGGCKRLGAYCPDDQEYLGIRLTRATMYSQQFVDRVRLLRASHPAMSKFILNLDIARSYHTEVVKEWLARHPEFQLELLPSYSPDLNLIKLLGGSCGRRRSPAGTRRSRGCRAAVWDHLGEHRSERVAPMAAKFRRRPQASAAAKWSAEPCAVGAPRPPTLYIIGETVWAGKLPQPQAHAGPVS